MRPPAMTPTEVAEHDSFAPTVRVTCYRYECGGPTLYCGQTYPEGGAEAVFEAAGCPEGTCPGQDPEAYAAPAGLERLTSEPVARRVLDDRSP